MSGHSKWANIKHKKSRSDAKRGKLFSKLVKEIMVASRMGGSDPGSNARLRSAIEKGKGENLPADNIERAIKKGAGELEAVNYEEGIYEGYGPANVAVLVSFMTDNRNRTVSEVRRVFTKYGGHLGESGSVGWIFEKIGLFTFDPGTIGEEHLMEAAIEAGAEDVIAADGLFEVRTDPSDFHKVKSALDKMGLKYTLSEITMMPKSSVHVESDAARKVMKFLDEMEDLDDVQDVYANFDMSDEDMDEVA